MSGAGGLASRVFRRLTNVWYPERFQGAHKQRNYFEGYYCKVVDAELGVAVAFIPGLSYDAQGEGHAFVQVLDGVAGTAEYHRYPISEFSAGNTGFELCVGPHVFSDAGCHVRLPGYKIDFGFRQNRPWPRRWYSPGAMGPFSFVPAMECRHGVVSLHHQVVGKLNNQTLSPQAVGYIEKDWGRSFPRSWVWLQSSHLDGETESCCLMVSSGRVPWLTGAFEGFIAALLLRGKLYRFTTYLGSRMTTSFSESSVRLVFRTRNSELRIVAHYAPGVDLVSPVPSDGMHGRVNESLCAHAEVRFTKRGEVLLDTTARWMGFEVGGEQPDLGD